MADISPAVTNARQNIRLVRNAVRNRKEKNVGATGSRGGGGGRRAMEVLWGKEGLGGDQERILETIRTVCSDFIDWSCNRDHCGDRGWLGGHLSSTRLFCFHILFPVVDIGIFDISNATTVVPL